jgi:hypothetical protein
MQPVYEVDGACNPCRVILLFNFLDDVECEHIIRQAEAEQLTRSLTSA